MDRLLADSFDRVNEKYFQESLDKNRYKIKWKKLSGKYGHVTYSRDNAVITLNERLKTEQELLDYTMLHELLHTIKGFRGVRRHRGKFNNTLKGLIGVFEYKRLEGRLKEFDISLRKFRKRYVYECPNCRQQITRKRSMKDCSCINCDRIYNPDYKFVLIDKYEIT